MIRHILIGISFFATALLSAATVADNAVTADPKHYTVEFENDRVRIIRIKYGPHEKSVMHTHGPAVVVNLTAGEAQMTLPDGTSETATAELGSAAWNDAQEHSAENLSDAPLEAILVELKD